jgi:hypothetical protein
MNDLFSGIPKAGFKKSQAVSCCRSHGKLHVAKTAVMTSCIYNSPPANTAITNFSPHISTNSRPILLTVGLPGSLR